MSDVLSCRPRTIQIHLPSDDPFWILQAELPTSIGWIDWKYSSGRTLSDIERTE
jgi:hypothetical protein